MMRKFALIIILALTCRIAAQEVPQISNDSLTVAVEGPDFQALDSLYREDQFYFGFTYNILQKRPEGISQNKFSSGISFGFLRDMPFNKRRTWSIAAGIGYTVNNFNQNLEISKVDGEIIYDRIGSEVSFEKNKIILNYIDLPIEIRWRTSTPKSHKFWRVYTGLKFSYLVFDKYKYSDPDISYSISKNKDFNKFQYGGYFALGYNTWNFNIFYGLNPIFKSSAKLNGNSIDMHTLNIGLMFYIL